MAGQPAVDQHFNLSREIFCVSEYRNKRYWYVDVASMEQAKAAILGYTWQSF